MGSGRNSRKLVCASALLLSALVGAIRLGIAPAAADYQSGVDAYQLGDFRAAYEAWQPLAQEGDPVAQNSLGALYDHGLGVPQDDVKAAYWYEKAAKQDLPLAMRNLGTLFANGNGVPRDIEQAKFWLQKAADAGDAQAGDRLAALTRSVPPQPALQSTETAEAGDGAASSFPSEIPQQSVVQPVAPAADTEATPEPSETSGPPPSGVASFGEDLVDVPSAIEGVDIPSMESTPDSSTETADTTPAEPSSTDTETASLSELPAPATEPPALEASGLPKSTEPQPESGIKNASEAVAATAPSTTPLPVTTPPASGPSDPDPLMPVSPTTEAMTTKTDPLQLAPAGQPATPESTTTEPTPSAAAAEPMEATPAVPTPDAADEAPMETPAAESPAPASVDLPVTTTPVAVEPSTPPVQSAAVVAPAPALENWLLGEWQGPTQGCPPGGGVEFGATESKVYYRGQINATLPVAYRVDPGSITVSTVGPDGITQDYVYQRTGTNSMIIVGIPPGMPRTLLGAAHRRCGAAPSTPTQQANMTAPIAVYPDSTPPVTDNQVPPRASAADFAAQAAAPISGAPAAAPTLPELPTPPKTTTPASVSAPEPDPMPEAEPMPEPEPMTAADPVPGPIESTEPMIPELKPDESAEAAAPETSLADEPELSIPDEAPTPEASAEEVAPALPKTTVPASTADKEKKAEEERIAAEAAAEAASVAATVEAETPPQSTEPTVPAPEMTADSSETTPSEAAAEPEPVIEAEPSVEPAPATDTAEASAMDDLLIPEPVGPQPEPLQEAAAAPPPAPQVAATQEELGQEALDMGNIDKALEIWSPLARAGNTGIAVNVGGMYEFGHKPMQQDYAKAVEWYSIAAENGDPYAQYKVGRAYTRGTGVPIDRVQAYKWLTIGMQSISNADGDGKTGKVSRMELETALNDIVGAMSQEEVTRASQLVRQYNEQHQLDD